MSLVKTRVLLKADLHHFPENAFGSVASLVNPAGSRARDTLVIACSELGAAPDCISFGNRNRFLVLQHLAASIPSKSECEGDGRHSFRKIEKEFEKHDFRQLIVCGHLSCGVISHWLQPVPAGFVDVGGYRIRYEQGARRIVENNYSPGSAMKRLELMIFEHVLCQIENLLTHPFLSERVRNGATSLHGWVIDADTARVYSYRPTESAYVII